MKDFKRPPFLRTLWCFTILFVLVPAGLRADEVNVNCAGGGSGVQAAINNLSPSGPHTINVTGTCLESVTIDSRDQLTIEGSGGAILRVAASQDVVVVRNSSGIVLRGLTIDGANQDNVAGVMVGTSDLSISNSTILNSPLGGVLSDSGDSVLALGGRNAGDEVAIRQNGLGVRVSGGRLRILGRTTIENNAGPPVHSVKSDLSVEGASADEGNTFRNNALGIVIQSGGTAGFNGRNLIESNGPYGVAANSGFLSFQGGVTGETTSIQGHTQYGIVAFSTIVVLNAAPGVFHQVHNNGTDPGVSAAIRLDSPGSARLRGVEIADNTGAGIVIESGAAVFLSRVSISGNSGDGIRLRANSTARFGGVGAEGEVEPADTTISGNGGRAIACDATSVVYGDVAGLPSFKCK